MSATGEVYVTVNASVANAGISTLAISGNTSIVGTEELSFTIKWEYNPNGGAKGITGKSWYGNMPYSPLQGYTDSGYNEHLATLPDSEVKAELDGLFDSWSSSDKAGFWMEYRNEIWGCLDAASTSS